MPSILSHARRKDKCNIEVNSKGNSKYSVFTSGYSIIDEDTDVAELAEEKKNRVHADDKSEKKRRSVVYLEQPISCRLQE